MPGFVVGNLRNAQPCPNGESGRFDNSYFLRNQAVQHARPSHTLEYLRDYRYVLRPATGDQDFDTRMQLSCKSIIPPKVSTKTVKIFNGPDYITRPLRKDYGDVSVTFEAILDEGGTDRVPILTKFYKWWEQLHVTLPSSQSSSPLNRKGANIIISLQDGYGRAVWGYQLLGAFPDKISTKDLSYSGEGLFDLTISVQYGKFIII